MLFDLLQAWAWLFFLSGGLILFLTYLYQHSIIYVPYIPPTARTEFLIVEDWFHWHIPVEKIFIETQDGEKLQAWFFKSGKPEATTWLFFHGNAGNLSFRLPLIQQLVTNLHINVLILSYRGYGLSTGLPTQTGLQLDAEAALAYLRSRDDINKDKIVAFGRSLGGAVAINLAANYPDKVHGLVIENSFTSIIDMIDTMFPIFSCFKFICTSPWESNQSISKLPEKMPVLFISGQQDELVPPRMMQTLFDLCSSKEKHMSTFPDGTHMETFACREYNNEMKNWLIKYFEPK